MGWSDNASLRRNNLDFLRFFLASLVIFSHSFALLSGTDDTEPLMRLTRGQICSGAFAVDAFFIISGFLITHSWIRGRGPLDFARKRAARIYPGFIAAMLFLAFVVAPMASPDPYGSFAPGPLRNLLFGSITLRGYGYRGAFLGNPWRAINGSLWSISYEVWCYVGVAMLGMIGLLRTRRFVLSLFVVSLLCSVLYAALHLRLGGKILGVIFGSPGLWARLLPYYLAGVVFYLFRDLIPCRAWLASAAAVVLGIAVFVPYGMTVAVPIAGTYLLFWFAFNPAIPLQGWAKYGDFSYGIYLYAFPIQQLLIHWFSPLKPMGLLALSLPLSIGFGIGSYHFVEKRFISRKAPAVQNICATKTIREVERDGVPCGATKASE